MSELLLSMMVLGLVMVCQGGTGCFSNVVVFSPVRADGAWLLKNFLLAHLAFDRLSGVFFFLFRRRTLLCKRAVYRARPWAWELRQMF